MTARLHYGRDAEFLIRYAGWLAGAGIERGLIGPSEAERLWERHLFNSTSLAELIPNGSRLVDVGTGAGLPGLAVACIRPDLKVDLVEPLLRRVTFLEEVVNDLGLSDRVRVVRGRADEASVITTVGQSQYVTARAVAPIVKLYRWCRPLLSTGGNLLAIKGERAADELHMYRNDLVRAGTDIVGIIECGVTLVRPPVRVVHLRRR